MEKMGMHCGRMLAAHMKNDEKIYVLDGDLADSNGAICVHQQHPERFIMAGIAEQSMVSVAAGMASVQLKPWVFSFAAFLCYRAYDQIRIGLSQAKMNVKLVGSHAGGFTGRNGQTHAAINDIAVMASLPNIHIWSPACKGDLAYAMDRMLKDEHPTYLRLPREPLGDLPSEPKEWYWLKPARRVTLVATGLSVHIALQVHKLLSKMNMEVGVINVNKIVPLPESLLHSINALCTEIIVIEDHYQVGGLASMLSIHRLSCRIHAKGWGMNFTGQSGDYEEILHHYDLNPHRICQEVLTLN
ncbi:hypothetical protein KK083_01220 [Fulvivirgaceae bacterium PWU4]|uniref:Transketolase-like pyrimidine-binding domain-containing protein n=1 Tax=Chryseosolibacter histidini TaxID=2782349 RepID=A0AAP2DFJ5_9BACT|nr:transketolase C-terminal domain-containing protein [Chryseosolibacter histidini]MBT1695476.1 hypothetical protein [Chryseosolibacter histidini]